jgi:hypothetical protein
MSVEIKKPDIAELSEKEKTLYDIVVKNKSIPLRSLLAMENGNVLIGCLGKLTSKGFVNIKVLNANEQPDSKLRKIIELKE